MKISRKQFFFLVGYFSYVLSISFIVNINIPLSHLFKGFSLICQIISILEKKYPVRKLFLMSIILTVFAYTSYKVQSESVIMLFLFIFSYPGGDFKRIIKFDMLTRGFGIICTNICYAIGIAGDVVLVRYTNSGHSIRHSLGFLHPNICYAMVFIVIIDFYLLQIFNNNRIKWYTTVIVAIISFIYETQTGARGAFVIQWLTVLLFYLEFRFEFFSRHRKIAIIMSNLSIIMCLFSILIEKLYEKNSVIGAILNSFATNRISSMYYYWNNYKITIFGQMLNKLSTQQAMLTGERALVLDNFYFNLILGYGMLFTVVFLYLYIKLCRNIYLSGNVYIFIVLCVFAIYGLVEGTIINIDYNYFLILLSPYLFSQKWHRRKSLIKGNIANGV